MLCPLLKQWIIPRYQILLNRNLKRSSLCLPYVHIAHFKFSNVEEAIQALPASEPHSPILPFAEAKASSLSPHAGEESAQLLAISTPTQTLSDDAMRLLQKTGDTISKPLSAIGRIFSEALDGAENKFSYHPGPPLESEGSHISRTPTPALNFAAVKAQIDSAHEQAATAARETLIQIFPTVDVEVVELVLEANSGDLGKSIEGLLEMSSGS